MSLQFRDKDVMRDSAKCFAQVQVDDISCSSLIHQRCNPIIEGYLISQTRFALNEAMLAVINHLLIFHPVPMLDHPFSKEIFPNIQPKPLLMQLEAISSRPITCYLGKETNTHLTTTSFQVVVESDKVSPEPPLLQTKQSQFPQPLLIRLVLQTLHQLRCPSLDTLQHLNVLHVVRGPKLNTVFEVWSHQCQVQGHDHFPTPAGHTIPDTSQDAVGFLGHLGTLPAHVQPAVNQHPQVLLCQAAFQPLFPKPVVLHGVVVTQVQDLALGLVEPHTIDPGPSIQPVWVSLTFLPSSRLTLPHNLVSSANLLRAYLIPSSRSLIKIFNSTASNTEPWGTLLVTGCQLDLTPFTTTLWAQPSSQFFTQ
ncbi:LOW QUALITY PROTEIN: hypothetical protein QYF61_020827 [Mycteria americana]|uniref:Uncharacterized protein n=1 Tax=Mycteria americana TaxID=33587 RepID=A0AAN7PKX9_MYCAM|nr:LOW QUALITY PROTEIN: hypothetical protein QYF61_020827 [Mycteria americana]